MTYLSVRTFHEHQHYRDRNPVWIKLYNRVMDDDKFLALSDAARGHLLLIWLLASRRQNKIPNDAKLVAKAIQATGRVNLAELIASDFLVLWSESLAEPEQSASTLASDVLAEPEQSASAEREREREGEERQNTRALSAGVIEAAESSVRAAMRDGMATVDRFISTRRPHTHGNWFHEIAKLLGAGFSENDIECALSDALAVDVPIAGPHALRIFASKSRSERVRASIPAIAIIGGSRTADAVNDDADQWAALLDLVSRIRRRSITADELAAEPYALRSGLRAVGGWQAVNEAKPGSLPFLRRDYLLAMRAAAKQPSTGNSNHDQ